jgi:pimeloyl-ACP methyl ester carboxylesterase
VRLTFLGVLTTLTLSLLPLAPPAGAAPTKPAAPKVVSRAVTFDVENYNSTSALCAGDDQTYPLSGRLVGPRRSVEGLSDALRVTVLVHDDGTGSWFWHLPSLPSHDYAGRLARRGETVLVIDRLGYGASGRPDRSCLGAQADVLHQVVQHLRSGTFEFTKPRFGSAPAAAHVVLQGHGTGAAIAQLEAGTFDDVDGLALMSWTDSSTTTAARETVSARTRACTGGATTAPAAADDAAFRQLLFARAPEAVQARASALRAPVPCTDVLSRTTSLSAVRGAASRVDAPVLLLYGDADPLTSAEGRATQATAYAAEVTTRTFAGSGNAVSLERPAQVTNAMLAWLG